MTPLALAALGFFAPPILPWAPLPTFPKPHAAAAIRMDSEIDIDVLTELPPETTQPNSMQAEAIRSSRSMAP